MAPYNLFLRLGATAARLRLLIKLPTGGHPTIVLRLIYLVLGAFFGMLTARVLLWEVHSFSDLTVDHYLTIGAMIGAIASGVFFWNTLLAGSPAAIGLGVAFAAATVYCLIGSAGRSDELAFERNATARQINKDRDRAQRNRDEARRRYDMALEAETAECNSGTGRKCIGKRETTAERRTEFEVAELLLQQAKPEQRENGKLKRAAQVIALFTSASEDGAERGLAIIWPFLPPFICELLTITFLHLGLGHRAAPPVRKPEVSPVETLGNSEFPTADIVVSAYDRRLAVVQALERAGRPVTNAELAALMGVSKGESSKRVAFLNGAVDKVRVGHFVAIALRKPNGNSGFPIGRTGK